MWNTIFAVKAILTKQVKQVLRREGVNGMCIFTLCRKHGGQTQPYSSNDVCCWVHNNNSTLFQGEPGSPGETGLTGPPGVGHPGAKVKELILPLVCGFFTAISLPWLTASFLSSHRENLAHRARTGHRAVRETQALLEHLVKWYVQYIRPGT